MFLQLEPEYELLQPVRVHPCRLGTHWRASVPSSGRAACPRWGRRAPPGSPACPRCGGRAGPRVLPNPGDPPLLLQKSVRGLFCILSFVKIYFTKLEPFLHDLILFLLFVDEDLLVSGLFNSVYLLWVFS